MKVVLCFNASKKPSRHKGSVCCALTRSYGSVSMPLRSPHVIKGQASIPGSRTRCFNASKKPSRHKVLGKEISKTKVLTCFNASKKPSRHKAWLISGPIVPAVRHTIPQTCFVSII